METAECWQAALERTDGPTVLCLSRQGLVQARLKNTSENLSNKGAYELLAAEGGKAQVSIFASGSEVEIAVKARALLAEKGVHARVVSVPSMELFNNQDEAYRKSVIGTAPVRIGVEAALRFGWDSIIGEHGLFVGMTGFGASAPAKDLYKHFGITAEAVADKVMARHNS